MTAEVLIAGAGPVGLTMAVELARYGVPVRIVDRAPQGVGQSRALLLWGRTIELLDRAGCAAAMVAAGTHVTAANILAGGKMVGRIDMAAGNRAHPHALVLPQSETERLLEAELNRLGVQVERSVELTSHLAAPDGVAATLRRGDGTTEKVNSGWLIGCDGAQSRVRDGMRMVFTGDAQPSRWILADVRLSGDRAPGEIDIGWHADGLLAILPIAGDRCRVMADVGVAQSSRAAADPVVSQVQALLDRRASRGLTAFAPEWLAGLHSNERKVANYRAGHVFLAGEAAHVHSPIGSQGLNLGIQDAVNLAWKLALVHHRVCADEPLLGSYSSECGAVCERVLKGLPGKLHAPASLRGEVKESVRNHIASLMFGTAPAQNAAAEGFTDLGYPDSPLNIAGEDFPSGPESGERAPVRKGEAPFGGGGRPRFALCVDASDATSRHGAEALLGIYKDLLEPEVRAPYAEGGLWLVRPDGYVALSARRDERDRVAAYLDQIHRARRLIHQAAALPTWLDSK